MSVDPNMDGYPHGHKETISNIDVPKHLLDTLSTSFPNDMDWDADYWVDTPFQNPAHNVSWTVLFAALAESHGWKVGGTRYRAELRACFQSQLAADCRRVTKSVDVNVLELQNIHDYWIDFAGFKYDPSAHWADNFNTLAHTCKWAIGGELYFKEMRLCYQSHLLFDDGDEYEMDDADDLSDAEEDQENDGLEELEEYEEALSAAHHSSEASAAVSLSRGPDTMGSAESYVDDDLSHVS